MANKDIRDSASKSENDLLFVLVSYIRDNNLGPGEKLPPIRTLAQVWNVSPSVVRSVLIKASLVGFIEMVQGSGCFVKNIELSSMTVMFTLLFKTTMILQNSQFINLYEIKAAVEAAMFRTAARTRTTEEVYKLKNILIEMNKVEKEDDNNIKIALDDNFHITIARMTRNPLYETLVTSTQLLLREDRLGNGPSVGYIERHIKLYEAIRDGDEEAAEKLGKTHSDSRRKLLTSLDGYMD